MDQGSDEPAWARTTTGSTSSLSWYGSSIGGDLGLVVTDGVASVQLSDIHGDIATTLSLDASNAVAGIGAFSDFDEYGRVLTVQPDTGAITYGWLGAQERATDDTTGLLLMGVRLYNPVTGLFTSVDPVPGGNTTAYAYPQDPINKYDLDGKAWGWLKKAASIAKVVAKVAEVASFIPGPIGMVASGVAVAAHLVSGNYKAAAAAAIGLVPGGKLLATAAKVASRAGKAAKATKGLSRAASLVRRSGCNSFEANTAVLLADGTSKPIEDLVVGDLVLAANPETGEVAARPVTDLIRHLDPHTWIAVTAGTVTGVETIEVTAEHPFWVTRLDGAGEWVYATDLAEGDVLASADGAQATVLALEAHEATEWAYNLTVADLHTYFVGDQPILVHNSSCPLAGHAHPHPAEVAASLGFSKAKGIRSHGQAVYTRGQKAISHDVDGHRGGYWKVGVIVQNRFVRKSTWSMDLRIRKGR